jgi:HAD superfamily hydrolase (TIGR01450 family)
MTEDTSLIAGYDALLLDLDGVVYVGPHAVTHAASAIGRARSGGVSIAFVTNNASRPPAVVAEHLCELGIDASQQDVVNASQAAAHVLSERLPAGSTVLAIGGPGVRMALTERGLVPVDSAEPTPAAVMMGYGPDVGWKDLAEASYAVHAGALFVATNPDKSFPTPRGIAPGNGTLVAAVVAATGCEPIVAGKPFAPLVRESIDRVGAARPLMIGDRLDTDIEAAYNTGIDSLLVMTGVSSVRELVLAAPNRRPTFVTPDLRGLFAPAQFARVTADPVPSPLSPLLAAVAAAWQRADASHDPLAGLDLDGLAALVNARLADK